MENLTQPASQLPPSAGAPNGEMDLTGRTLGDFHILRRLGEGGMGQVYLAEQLSLKRKVALKILRADLAANPTSLERFKAEALAVARATHANIVQVYSIGEFDGLHTIALEYVEGRNLRDHLVRKGSPDLLLAMSIMRQVTAALQRANELGIIHRDIKPENILLTRKGEVKVADFGLSRCRAPDQQPLNLTQSGVTMGTPLYMSPEQVEGKPVDHRTDIYSFGVTCYHMLAGNPPFQGETAFAVAIQHVQTEATPLEAIRPDLPADLCAAVMKMMAKDPAQRYQTASELLKELVRLRESLTGIAAGLQTQAFSVMDVPALTPTAVPMLVAPPRRPWRWLPWAMAATVLLAASGGGYLAYFRHVSRNLPPPSGPPPTTSEREDIEALFSPQKREEVLLKAVKDNTYTNTDRVRMHQALAAYLDLGLFYLDQWRIDDAERLFGQLENKQLARPYQFLGELGRAMVLAFRDKPDESNRLFLKLLTDKKPNPDWAEFQVLQKQNPQLRQTIARALDHNSANATASAPFPRELENLRKAPAIVRPRIDKDKPPVKGEE